MLYSFELVMDTTDVHLDFFFHFQTYSNLTAGQFQIIRQTLLSFFQDMHIRVSTYTVCV